MNLSQLAAAIDGQLIGEDQSVSGVSIDSRKIKAGELFVALVGPNHDAHHFIESVVVQHCPLVVLPERTSVTPRIEVADTHRALGRIGAAWIDAHKPKTIGITGSSGKTTVKELSAAILRVMGPTLATHGNLNNDIGVPLTLCQITPQHRFAVIEMGANHLGEINYTSALVRPHAALVNNIGPAHLEGFGSMDNIAKAKSEIYANLAPNGIAVVNLDDDYAPILLAAARDRQQVTFSRSNTAADVHLLSYRPAEQGGWHLDVQCRGQQLDVHLPLAGEHNIANALAAMALTSCVGADENAMREGLAAVKPTPGRMCPVMALQPWQVIDDSYNANPASVLSAIRWLASQAGERALVLGDMAELGADAHTLHESIGAAVAEAGIERFYVLGSFAHAYQLGIDATNKKKGEFVMAQSHQEIATLLWRDARAATVLIKGSRSAAMDNVIAHLTALAVKERD